MAFLVLQLGPHEHACADIATITTCPNHYVENIESNNHSLFK